MHANACESLWIVQSTANLKFYGSLIENTLKLISSSQYYYMHIHTYDRPPFPSMIPSRPVSIKFLWGNWPGLGFDPVNSTFSMKNRQKCEIPLECHQVPHLSPPNFPFRSAGLTPGWTFWTFSRISSKFLLTTLKTGITLSFSCYDQQNHRKLLKTWDFKNL